MVQIGAQKKGSTLLVEVGFSTLASTLRFKETPKSEGFPVRNVPSFSFAGVG